MCECYQMTFVWFLTLAVTCIYKDIYLFSDGAWDNSVKSSSLDITVSDAACLC